MSKSESHGNMLHIVCAEDSQPDHPWTYGFSEWRASFSNKDVLSNFVMSVCFKVQGSKPSLRN